MDPDAPPNPLDVIAAALQGVTTVDPETDALAIFNALLAAPDDTRRMVAAAMLNTFAPDDTVIFVVRRPIAEAMAKDAAQRWWPMLPHPSVLNSLQDDAAPVVPKPPAMVKEPKGHEVRPQPLRLV